MFTTHEKREGCIRKQESCVKQETIDQKQIKARLDEIFFERSFFG